MRTTAVVLFFCVMLSGVASLPAQNTPSPAATADPHTYGEYPLAYKEIIGRWLETVLLDPTSAAIDWTDAPKPGNYKTQKGEEFVGYIVDFKVNARNRFGAPTGKQRYRVVIKNGEVLWGGHPRT